MDIKAFIFDMDGLLFDSERIVQRSWEIAGDELGIPHMGNVIYHTLGMNRAGRNEYFRKYIREDFPFEEFGKLTRDNFWKIVDKEGLPLKKGAKELLAYGKSQEQGLDLALLKHMGAIQFLLMVKCIRQELVIVLQRLM